MSAKSLRTPAWTPLTATMQSTNTAARWQVATEASGRRRMRPSGTETSATTKTQSGAICQRVARRESPARAPSAASPIDDQPTSRRIRSIEPKVMLSELTMPSARLERGRPKSSDERGVTARTMGGRRKKSSVTPNAAAAIGRARLGRRTRLATGPASLATANAAPRQASPSTPAATSSAKAAAKSTPRQASDTTRRRAWPVTSCCMVATIASSVAMATMRPPPTVASR